MDIKKPPPPKAMRVKEGHAKKDSYLDCNNFLNAILFC